MATLQTKKNMLASKMSAPTPFKMIGSGIKSALTKVVGKVMEPSVRVGKIKDAEMEEMSRKAKAGEFNQ